MIERLRVRIPTGAAGECSFSGLTLCADSYSVFVPPRVATMARKTPRSFCQKCRSQVTPKHAHTLDSKKSEWAVFVQTLCENLSVNELARNLSGNIQPQSSQSAEPLWTDPGLKSGISVRELISTSNLRQKEERKKERKGKIALSWNEWSNVLPKSSRTKKKPPYNDHM